MPNLPDFTVTSATTLSYEQLQAMEREVLRQNNLQGATISWSQAMPTMPVPTLADRKAQERRDFKHLLEHGQSDLQMYASGDKLVVKGFEMNGTRTLFMLDDAKLLAPKKRTSHLKSLLIKLAQREGVELEFTNQLPPLSVRAIVYWPFKLEIDDSVLLTAKLRESDDEEAEEMPF